MAKDDSMMFPNDRIRTWLTNNRVGKETATSAASDTPQSDDSTNELDSPQSLDLELVS